MDQDRTTAAGSSGAATEPARKALLLRQFADSRRERLRLRPAAPRRAAGGVGRHQRFAQAIAGQHRQPLGARSRRFPRWALRARGAAATGPGLPGAKIYRRPAVVVPWQSAGGPARITVSLDLHQLLQTVQVHFYQIFARLNQALTVYPAANITQVLTVYAPAQIMQAQQLRQQTVMHAHNLSLILARPDAAHAQRQAAARNPEATRHTFMHSVQQLRRLLVEANTPLERLDLSGDRHSLLAPVTAPLTSAPAVNLPHVYLQPVGHAVCSDAAWQYKWAIRQADVARPALARLQAGAATSTLFSARFATPMVYQSATGRATDRVPFAPAPQRIAMLPAEVRERSGSDYALLSARFATPMVYQSATGRANDRVLFAPTPQRIAMLQQPGAGVSGSGYMGILVYQTVLGRVADRAPLTPTMQLAHPPAWAPETAIGAPGEVRPIERAMPSHTVSRTILAHVLKQVGASLVQSIGTGRPGALVYQATVGRLAERKQGLPHPQSLAHVARMPFVRAGQRSGLVERPLTTALPVPGGRPALAGSAPAELAAVAPAASRIFAAGLLQPKGPAEDERRASSARMAHSLQPAIYLRPPSLGYVFAQQAQPSIPEPQVVSRVEKQAIVELVKKEAQTIMAPRNVMMNFSRADYAQIADHVYSTLVRQMLMERERLSLRA